MSLSGTKRLAENIDFHWLYRRSVLVADRLPVEFGPRETAVLQALITTIGTDTYVPFERVYGVVCARTEIMVRVTIHKIRDKLNPTRVGIETGPGGCYRLVVTPETQEAAT